MFGGLIATILPKLFGGGGQNSGNAQQMAMLAHQQSQNQKSQTNLLIIGIVVIGGLFALFSFKK